MATKKITRSLGSVFITVLALGVSCDRHSLTSSLKPSEALPSSCRVTLFQSGGRAANYYEYLKQIIPPCTVVFSDTEFLVAKKLGEGGGSIVFATNQGKVLRLQLNPLQEKDLDDYWEIYKELKRDHVPVVLTERSASPHLEYLQHEYLEIEMPLREMEYQEGGKPFSQVVKETSFQTFLDFCEATSKYVFIADLHDGNVVRLKSGEWVAMDFGVSDPTKYATYTNQLFVKFAPKASNLERLKELLKRKYAPQAILDTAKKENWFNAFSQNTFTDLDPKTQFYMRLPEQWKTAIRERIFKARVKEYALQ